MSTYNELCTMKHTAEGLARPDLTSAVIALMATERSPSLDHAMATIRGELAAAVAARLANSDLLPPSVTPAVTVVLYGSGADDLARAGELASAALLGSAILMDRTPYEAPTAVGMRYTFRQGWRG
jgi:hypothetical protein